MTICP